MWNWQDSSEESMSRRRIWDNLPKVWWKELQEHMNEFGRRRKIWSPLSLKASSKMGNAKFGIWNQRKSWLTDTLETNNISHRQSQQNQPYQFDREKEILRRHDNVSMVVLHSLTSQEQRAQCGGSEILWNLGWSSDIYWSQLYDHKYSFIMVNSDWSS